MLWVGVAVACIAAVVLWGPIVSTVEQARYTVTKTQGAIEVRDYASMIVAETDVPGERKQAINHGFRIIADYIFGNNVAAQKVPMTAPVTSRRSEKVAMTAPVTQQGGGKSWTIRFVMPASSTMETLPKPNNSAVKLVALPAKRFVVIRFSGLASEHSLQEQTEALNAYLQAHHLNAVSTPTYAFYNPPWTLPFLRRNEVMVEIAT